MIHRRAVLHIPLFLSGALVPPLSAAWSQTLVVLSPIIDDLSDPTGLSALGSRWQLVTDQVMGGISRGTLAREEVAGRPALVMRGDVRLENNGGFVQMALDLGRPDAAGSRTLDARDWQGLEIDVCGAPQTYSLHLRTTDLERPWQSYRQGFPSRPEWRWPRPAGRSSRARSTNCRSPTEHSAVTCRSTSSAMLASNRRGH